MTTSRKSKEWWTYQKRALAFIDILGWKDLIKRSLEDAAALQPILEALVEMDIAVRSVKQVQAAYHDKPFSGKYVLQEVAHFSDTVVLSCDATKDAVGHLLFVCQQFCSRLLRSPHLILTRGAIVIGDLVHKDNVIFGPALVEAHCLESKTATNPRVLITPEVAALLDIQAVTIQSLVSHPIFTDQDDGWQILDLLYGAGETMNFWAHQVRRALRRKNGLDLKRPKGELRDKILRKNAWLDAYITGACLRAREAKQRGGRPTPCRCS
jgi:hypothetical protein